MSERRGTTAALAGLLAIGGWASATTSETAAAAPSPAVSYSAPPPPLTLAAFARIVPPAGTTFASALAAVADDGVTVIVEASETGANWRRVAYYAANDGTVSPPVPLSVEVGAVVPGPDHVIYGIAADPATGQVMTVAIPMGGPRLGQVIASAPIADASGYVEIGPAPFGNTSDGIVDLSRNAGTVLIGHVDQAGNPLDASSLPGTYLRQTATAIIDTGPPDAWDITIERQPGYTEPYAGEAPPARSAGRANVWATFLGLSPEPGVADPTLPVLAVMRPGARTEWYSVPDGWRYASSDVWGTIFVRTAADGAVEVARVDQATLTGVAPDAGDGQVCPDYVDHVEHEYPIKLCDSGLFVGYVQALLALNHGYGDLAIDGYYGPNTEATVRDFQRARGLEVDGLTGPRTWAALIAGSPGNGPDTDGSGAIDPWEWLPD